MKTIDTLRVSKGLGEEIREIDIRQNESFGDFELWYAGTGEYKKQRGFSTLEEATAALDDIQAKLEAAGHVIH